MSVEAHHSFEHVGPKEKAQGVEVAVKAIARIRLLLAEHRARLKAERAEKTVDREAIQHLKQAIRELEDELENTLAFLEEFDPHLFQKLKDNS